jgi:tetratricopeptide (TPR) repeat protein
VDADTYLARGDADLVQGDVQAALRNYTQALTLEPYMPRARVARALVYRRMEDWDNAVIDIEAAMQDDADLVAQRKREFVDVYLARARRRISQNDNSGAKADLDRAIRLDPRSAETYLERSLLLTKADQWELAANDYRTAEEIDPRAVASAKGRFAPLLVERGKQTVARGEIRQGIVLLGRAIGCDPRHADAYYCRGAAHFQLALQQGESLSEARTQLDKAVEDYEKAMSLDAALPETAKSKIAEAYRKRAVLNYNSKKLDEAVNDMTEFIRLQPDDPEAYRTRALFYSKQGNSAAAREDFQRARELR